MTAKHHPRKVSDSKQLAAGPFTHAPFGRTGGLSAGEMTYMVVHRRPLRELCSHY